MGNLGNKTALVILLLMAGVILSALFNTSWVMIAVFAIIFVVIVVSSLKILNQVKSEIDLRPGQIDPNDIRGHDWYPLEHQVIMERYTKRQVYTEEQVRSIEKSQREKQAIARQELIKRMNAEPVKKNDAESAREIIEETEKKIEAEFTRREKSETVIPYAAEPSPSMIQNRNTDTVVVSVQSLDANSSFVFYVDEQVIGYIGPQKSVLSVPTGMHNVMIITNDANRKQIFSENILFNIQRNFTIKKKFGGYSVAKS